MPRDEPRSYERITRSVLKRLAEIAAEDREDRFTRLPRWAVYRDRVLCVALCQGAGLHYVEGHNGVKDLDVYTFYAADAAGAFPPRWNLERRFDREPFRGRRVDLIGRSLPEPLGVEPLEALHRYLSHPRTKTARALGKKGVVLVDPEPLRGTVAWPL